MNIVSFSGGKDSTAILLMMLGRGIKVDRIVNVDTTKEFPQMYDHIRRARFEMEASQIEITSFCEASAWQSSTP